MKHHWIFPAFDEGNPPKEHIGTCSGCGAQSKVDQGPNGGARQHFRWSPDSAFSPKKLGTCPATAKFRFRVERTAHAWCLGIVIERKTGKRRSFTKNNVARCDAEFSAWDVRHAWDRHPDMFAEMV